MLFRKTKTKTTMQKLMRKLTSRMILKGKLYDSTHSTNSVFTPFRLRTNFHTEPNRILHWDQTYLSVSEIISQIHDDNRQTCSVSLPQASSLTALQNQKPSRDKWHISAGMNCHQPRDRIVKSLTSYFLQLSTTFDCPSFILSWYLFGKNRRIVLLKDIYALQFFNRYSPDCCLWLTIYSSPFSPNPVSQDDDENDNVELENPER